MTREEAARILEKQFDKSCGNYRYQNKDKLDYEDALWMAISSLRELEAQEKQKPFGEWISVKNRLPEPETEVFIRALRNGYEVLTTAMYEDGTISTDDSEWNWYDLDFDYDEERDIYLVPAGWWEYRHYNPDDVYNNVVDDEVTHWMPLPEPPKEEA